MGRRWGAASCTLGRAEVCLQLSCLFVPSLLLCSMLWAVPRGQQDRAPPPREGELTWTKILFIAEDEQGRLLFTTLIG